VRPVLDLHLWRTGEPGDVEAVGEELRHGLESPGFGRPMHRIDVTISAEPPGPRSPVTYHYCYRSAWDGLVEDMLYRNLHPMLAKRLKLERLSRFALTRLDSAEDVYLFHGVARDNPKDERLFALAEVRDLSPVLDGVGRVAAGVGAGSGGRTGRVSGRGSGRTSVVTRSPRSRGWITSATANSATPSTTSRTKLTRTALRPRGSASTVRDDAGTGRAAPMGRGARPSRPS
jgi:hypothetical protein